MRDLGPEEIAALVASLMMLVVWIAALRNQNAWNREMKRRKDIREAREGREAAPPPAGEDDRGSGPWG